MIEATMNRAAERPQKPGGPRFGAGIDARAAGRRGGQASGLSRRLRPQRQLEEKIINSKNGAAQAKLLEIRMRREAALDRERTRLDRLVCHLMDEADAERAMIARLRERRREYEAAVTQRLAALEQREAELRERLETDAGLDAFLNDQGEANIRASCLRLGWIDDDDNEDDNEDGSDAVA
jgi:hypothetical protein